MKKILFFVVVLGFLLGCQSIKAQDTPKGQENSAEAVVIKEGAQAVNIGNKICPVTDEDIEEADKATYEYNGVVYNFCCSACVEEFKKDPAKFIKKVEEELKARSQEKIENKSKEKPDEPANYHEEHLF